MNPIMVFNRWYDGINSPTLRLAICLVVVSPLFLTVYPPLLTPLLLKFGVGVFYSCLTWVLFLVIVRWWWLVKDR